MRVGLVWPEERWIMSDVKRYVNVLGNKRILTFTYRL